MIPDGVIPDGVIPDGVIPDGANSLIERLLPRCHLARRDAPLACAVSGGPDSIALLILAVAAGCRVEAHHVDHGARAGSSAEADLVKAWAARLGADFVAHQVEVEPGANFESRARRARYAVLPEPIATGHTLDDRAETIVLNLLRGAGRRGLSPHTDTMRHPIIGLRRTETHELAGLVADRLGLDLVDDPTNRDPAHKRNRVRHEALPLLSDIADRDIAALLDRQAGLLAAEDDLLDQLAMEIDPTNAREVASAHPALARRAVRNWIEANWELGYPPDAGAVERVVDVARGVATSTQIGAGHRVYRTNQILRVDPPSLR